MMSVRFTAPPRLSPMVGSPCVASFGCDRPAVARGLCTGHHHQVLRGAPLTPLRALRRAQARDALGRKECGSCRAWLPTSSFHVDRKQGDGLLNLCRRCVRSATLVRKYGITVEEFEAMVAAQNDLCAICRTPSERELVVDHDHECCPGRTSRRCCVRGCICAECNLALGLAHHEIDRLEAMVAYLSRDRG
jgi:Recombination endonuclease VII